MKNGPQKKCMVIDLMMTLFLLSLTGIVCTQIFSWFNVLGRALEIDVSLKGIRQTDRKEKKYKKKKMWKGTVIRCCFFFFVVVCKNERLYRDWQFVEKSFNSIFFEFIKMLIEVVPFFCVCCCCCFWVTFFWVISFSK